MKNQKEKTQNKTPSATEPSATEPSATEPSATEPSATEPSATATSATATSATATSATEPSATATSAIATSATEPSATARIFYARFIEASDKTPSPIKTRISKPEKRICHCGRPFFANRNDDSKSGTVCSRKCYFSQGECSCAELLGRLGCFCGLQASKK